MGGKRKETKKRKQPTLNDPGNSKQTNGDEDLGLSSAEEMNFNSSSGSGKKRQQSKKSKSKRSEDKGMDQATTSEREIKESEGEIVSTQFMEDDEVFKMRVSEEEEMRAFASEEEGDLNNQQFEQYRQNDCEDENENGTEISDQEEEFENQNAALMDRDRNLSEISEDEEVTFAGENNNNIRKKDLVDLNLSDDEDFNAEEIKSTKKFARFLEKTGFIQKKRNGMEESAASNDINKKSSVGSKNEEKNKSSKLTTIKPKNKGKEKSIMPDELDLVNSGSETTIYRRAIPMSVNNCLNMPVRHGLRDLTADPNRISSSSEEEEIYTSDESIQDITQPPKIMELTENRAVNQINNDQILYQQFLDCRRKEQRQEIQKKTTQKQPQPSSSSGGKADTRLQFVNQVTPEERSRQLIQQAEANKARMLKVPGRSNKNYSEDVDLLHSVMVDGQYTLVSVHVDEATRTKIIEGYYVD